MRAVFLDLDGTLTDSGEGILNSVAYELDEMGLPKLVGDNSWLVGPLLWDSFAQLGVAEDGLDQAVALYRARYTKIGYLENRLYDSILKQLSKLQTAGYSLYLATSKPHSYATKITTNFGISNYLTDEFSSELDGTQSDKPALLAHGLAVVNVPPVQAIMVGGRSYDAVGAQANGMKVLGAVYGFGTRKELRVSGVDGLIETPHDLAATVVDHLPI
jgi:phosphoglycolate phosphatase